jgi:hypothetical protein
MWQRRNPVSSVTDKSRSALQSLVEGRDARLMQLGPEHDRHERLVAFVQQVMLEQGQVRVSARIGDKACADVLLSAGPNRTHVTLGPMADPNFARLQSENTGLGLRGVNLCW